MDDLQGSASLLRVHVLAVIGKRSGFPTVSAGVLQGLLGVLRKARKREARAARERAALREFAASYLVSDGEPCVWPDCGCGVHDCAAQRGEAPMARPWSPSRAKYGPVPHIGAVTGTEVGWRYADVFRGVFEYGGLDAPTFIVSGSVRKIEGAFEPFSAQHLTMRTVLDL